MSKVSLTPASASTEGSLDQNIGMANIDERARSTSGSNTSELIRSGDYLRENAESRNIIKLLSGIHQGFSLSKPFSHVEGEAGVIVNRLATITADAVISNVYFRQDEDPNNIDHLVKVSGDSSVLFTNCVFQRKYTAPSEVDPALPAPPVTTKCFVLIEAAARAIFTGCVFRSSQSAGVMNAAGTVVQSLAPAAGSVYVGAGSNFTTHNHGTTVTVYAPEIA
tara:strand:+ start:14912 stop:15577 length:666 start_codon:yes stop_codon:yes gene_type:complete